MKSARRLKISTEKGTTHHTCSVILSGTPVWFGRPGGGSPAHAETPSQKNEAQGRQAPCPHPPCEADVLLEISMLEPRDKSTQLTHERAQNVCACGLDFSDSWWHKITLADRASDHPGRPGNPLQRSRTGRNERQASPQLGLSAFWRSDSKRRRFAPAPTQAPKPGATQFPNFAVNCGVEDSLVPSENDSQPAAEAIRRRQHAS